MQFLTITLVVGIGIFLSQFVCGKQDLELSCPPKTPVRVCDNSCSTDSDCQDNKKCCPTECGGSYCVQPVTPSVNPTIVKEGYCPPEPKGTWLCSSRCNYDSDCKGRKKCCPNRCGALDCLDPIH